MAGIGRNRRGKKMEKNERRKENILCNRLLKKNFWKKLEKREKRGRQTDRRPDGEIDN